MKNRRVVVMIALLFLLVSLSCKAVTGGLNRATEDAGQPENTEEAPFLEPSDVVPTEMMESTEATEQAPSTAPDGGSGQTIPRTTYPTPPGAEIMQEVSGTLVVKVSQSVADVVKFYREEMGKRGWQEDTLLTMVEDSTFSMVFKNQVDQLIVQGVDMGDGTTIITLRSED